MAKVVKPANPPQDPPDDDDDEVEFSPRQLEVINQTVTAAVTSHVKRGLKPMQDQLAVLPTIQETLEKLANGGAPKPGAEGGDDKNKQPAPAPTVDPEKVAMKKRLDAIEAEREAERVATREARRDTLLTEIATKAGVDKNRMRGAVALLRGEAEYDKDSGKYVMKVQRHGLEEHVPIEEGAAEFFRGDEGKAYLAPTNAAPRGGTGTGRGGATNAQQVTQRSNAPAKGTSGAKEAKKQKAAEDFVGAVGELFSGGNIDVGG